MHSTMSPIATPMPAHPAVEMTAELPRALPADVLPPPPTVPFDVALAVVFELTDGN